MLKIAAEADVGSGTVQPVAREMKMKQAAGRAQSRMAGPERGAVAFSKTGDPQLGEWRDAVILGRYGDVPDLAQSS